MTGISYRAPTFHFTILPMLRRASRTIVYLLILGATNCAYSLNPESPEVHAVVDKGLEYLNTHNDERLGGRCLVALAFLKNGASNEHTRVREAVLACEAQTADHIREESVYDNGLAIIFLAELDPVKYHDLIERFANVLKERQKPHGGWGYEAYQTGDTSQTQYAILSYWQLMQIGLAPSVESVEAGANWLLRTQDPSGGWGYQGKDPGNFQQQSQDGLTLSMLSAGLGSTLICANVLGTIQPGESPQADETVMRPKEKVPSALRAAEGTKASKIRTLSGAHLDKERVLKAIAAGQATFKKNFATFMQAEYPFYLLYSIERYKSFEEFLTGNTEEEPEWYEEGFKFAKARQAEDGSWNCPSGKPCATAFTILFLSRSTQKSIKAKLGEGTLVGGRGLSANLARMQLKQGRLVKERKPTDVDNLLKMLEETDGEDLDSLLDDKASIDVKDLGPDDARQLEQLLRTGKPEARLLAVESLSKLRDLDYVPSLIYALTDPDKRIVRAARDGLEFVSRRFVGFGPPDNFTEEQRYESLEKWKQWYRHIRPNVPALP